MKFKEDIDIVRKRLYAFWENEIINRALVSLTVSKDPNRDYSMFAPPEDLTDKPEELRKAWEDPETIYKNNMLRLENSVFLGEALPIIFQNYGTSGHCNYFGAVPTYGRDTIWFDPVWKDLDDAVGSYTEERLKKHLEITKYLVDHAEDNYFIGMPDNCGALDALGHLYGSENVLMDMITEEDSLKKAIKIINDGWKKTNEQFYQLTKDINGGGAHAWMDLLAPGKLMQMECDMSVMFSLDMYEKFVADELREQIEWLDYPVYHFDGIEQERHLDCLLGFKKLKAIQWTHVAGQPSASHYMPILQRIQAAGKGLIVWADPDEIPTLLENLSAKGLYIHTYARDIDTANEIIRYIEKNSRI